MLYPMPKKIQFLPSKAKWSVSTEQSVLLLVGLHELRAVDGAEQSELLKNIIALVSKAKALEIPIVDLNHNDEMQGMQRLGEQLSHHSQLMIAGNITPLLKQVLPHLMSVSQQICIIEDAVLLQNVEQHIQWIDSLTTQKVHHISAYSLKRLWSLSAPSEQILSTKGVLLALAEQLDLAPLDIHPTTDLREYGLDSVAMVTLIGLWRANGAEITYEDFLSHCSLEKLFKLLQLH